MTHDKMIISLSECVIWFIVLTAECVVIVTANLLTIILFIKNRSLRTRSMYLVMSLTVADLLVGSLSASVNQFFSQNFYCPLVNSYSVSSKVLIFIVLIFPLVSLTNIAVISLERFHATFRPFRHRLIKRWVYVTAIAVVWGFPIITLVINSIEKLLMIRHLYLLESHCFLCLIVTFVSYASIFFKFRFGAHPLRHYAAALRHRKLTVTLFITTLVSLLLWLPVNIYILVLWLTDSVRYSISFPEYVRLNYSLVFLFFANSLVNPILYAIRIAEFKKALVSLFRRHQRENAPIPLNRF